MSTDRKSRRPPPARARYAERHPAITVHLPDRETHARLIELRDRTGLSLGQLVRQTLGVVEKDIEDVYCHAWEEGEREGWSQAEAHYRLAVACTVCHEPLEVTSGSPAAQAAASALAGWRHARCHEQLVHPG